MSIESAEARQPTGRWVGAVRLALGAAQGLGLWFFFTKSEAIWGVGPHRTVMAYALPLLLIAPTIPLFGIGRLRPGTLLAWLGAACTLLVLLVAYDLWRAGPPTGAARSDGELGPFLILAALAVVYILHHLIEPADAARRWRPPYAAYVGGSWRHGLQIGLGLGFAAAVWGVLRLSGALFGALGLAGMDTLLTAPAVMLPGLGLAFAGAVHATDTRLGSLAGRFPAATVLVTALAVLATGLLSAFLGALLVTGLGPLWATGHATALLLTGTALLIVIVNAAYGDGTAPEARSPLLRAAVRLAGLLLAPLLALALTALCLRIAQHGLTPIRVWGVAACAVGAIYAAGYGWAALRARPWMGALGTTNVIGAVAIVLALLLLLSPVADPARLSTADQIARLESGRTGPESLDVTALRFRFARYGREALAQLAASKDPVVADLAREARNRDTLRGNDIAPRGPAFAGATIAPPGASLPEGFREQAWPRGRTNWDPSACLSSARPCILLVVDLDGDGTPEVVAFPDPAFSDRVRVALAEGIVFRRSEDGDWRRIGTLSWPFDWEQGKAALASLRAGRAAPVKPVLPDLSVDGRRLQFRPSDLGTGARP
ncbi:DUF4153 domain-containing protein [Methylobacterium terricola]|uniref:DUF4153 domain-containing protein n=1 Tax=Methylobacterium terricola TaxID=2583531 RepID=A0A5C4LH43_9HYPH|nr:DUF4153 domain-containing protein [Methylobacterium terricola]TNC11729.1 DUF4153 domain-containing protein [Methylobacterium terricola]